MEMIMKYEVSFDCTDFNKETDNFDLGGYEFKINGMDIPFDFEAFSYNVELINDRLHLSYESGCGLLFNEYDLDSCFDEEYKKLGLTRDVIDAKFLASTNEIVEFHINFNRENKDFDLISKNFKIENIEFIDYETDEVFEVAKEVLDGYKL